MLRWVTIAENQLKLWITSSGRQPAATRSVTATRARLAMPHLLGPAALEQRFDGRGLRPARGDEDSELVVGKARIVRDGALMPGREQDVERDPEQRGERAEQHRHLEHDDDVRRDRADGLAAHLHWPVVRHVQRDPRADSTPG